MQDRAVLVSGVGVSATAVSAAAAGCAARRSPAQTDAVGRARCAVLVAALLVGASLAGCSTSSQDGEVAPRPTASSSDGLVQVGFCVGTTPTHHLGDDVTLDFMRGSEKLAEVSGPVASYMSVQVPPGDITVLVDGEPVMKTTVAVGGGTRGSLGAGCPTP